MENLRLFRDIAHQHSVSKAAKLNDISQSAASQQIQEIERDLGITLLDRTTRPLVVTEAGKMYLEYCRDVLRRRDELSVELSRLKKEAVGLVRVAAIYSVGLSEMSEIERRFSSRFPDGSLQVSYLRPERVYKAVEQDEADIGLMSYAESSREIVALPWRSEEMVVAIAPSHRLSSAPALEPAQLEGEQFIGFDEDLPISNEIARYLKEHKVTVEIALHFDNLQMIKEAAAHGAGISILPKRVLRDDLEANRLVAISLQPADLHRPLRIIHRRRKVFSDVGKGLLALLREETPGSYDQARGTQ